MWGVCVLVCTYIYIHIYIYIISTCVYSNRYIYICNNNIYIILYYIILYYILLYYIILYHIISYYIILYYIYSLQKIPLDIWTIPLPRAEDRLCTWPRLGRYCWIALIAKLTPQRKAQWHNSDRKMYIYIIINMCENCGKNETYLSHLGRTSVCAGRIIVILSRISSCQAYCYILVRICLFLESIYSRMYICTGRGPKT